MAKKSSRRWLWFVYALAVMLLIAVAIVVVPILLHRDGGSAGQQNSTTQWPLVVQASGEDQRDRELRVISAEPGGVVDTAALLPRQHLVISGGGYDAGQGIYVAFCAIPDTPETKPGPCLGGVPDRQETEESTSTIQWAPSNWINNVWAWKLFGARAYDDAATGTFTAYLEVPEPKGEGLDCTVVRCAIYTRNDHTAPNDRVQDLFIPIAFGLLR